MPVVIVNNRIDGLRVTIYDVFYYLQAGRSHEEIADILPLSSEQVAAAIDYIETHYDEVLAAHTRIETRLAQGNPPEVMVRARAGRAKMEALRHGNGAANGKEVDGEGAGGRRQ